MVGPRGASPCASHLEGRVSHTDKTSAAFSLWEALCLVIFPGPEKRNPTYCVVTREKDGVEPSWLEMRKVHHLSESESQGNSCSQSLRESTAGADDRLLSS